MSGHILEMGNIVKEFPGVRALDDVTFKVRAGEIHALVGENGAGKSTLIKVLGGVYPHGTYSGQIFLNGEEQRFNGIKDSERAGIAIIYQELALVKQMTIAENIFLGSEITKNGGIAWNEMVYRTKQLLARVGLKANPMTKIGHLGVDKQQLTEIAKAISKDVKILILDEPTAALNETESRNLLNIIKSFKEQGVTCIYISHKLGEVKDIADTITVLRDGRTIDTLENDEGVTEDRIISLMVGRELKQRYPRKEHTPGETVLEVEDWTIMHPELPGKKVIDNVSLKARKGEILGIAGLMGSGRTELSLSLFGADYRQSSGTVKINQRRLNIKEPRDAIASGLCYLTEDRKKNGLVLIMDVKENITLASLKKISSLKGINENEEIKLTNHYVNALKIKTPSIEQKIGNLSGGNQQKVSVAKWLMAEPRVIILDEPTRGVDVGAKYEIYNLMNELVEQGVCIIMISSELPEILGMADRIAVLHEGRITGELDWREATQEKIMYYATGGR